MSLLLAVQLALARPQVVLHMPSIFASNMVLQRDQPVPVWGWTEAGREVTVTFQGQVKKAIADATGRFSVTLDAMPAGGPGEMGISDANDDLIITNIAVGDVWLCSGQSNMVFPLSQSLDSTSEIEDSDLPKVRVFKGSFQASDDPRRDVGGQWKVCSPMTSGAFSAVAFHFAKQLARDENVPIGIVDCSWGGSSAEAWVPRSALAGDPELQPLVAAYEKAKSINAGKLAEYRRRAAKPRPTVQKDMGNRGFSLGYPSPKFDDSGWGTMHVPGFWEDQNPSMQIDGAVWFRRELNLPPSFAGHEATLDLGQISDFDTVYFNGQLVGFTPPGAEDPSGLVRRYTIPSRLVNAGANVIAVRVFNREGKGGFGSDPDHLRFRSSTSIAGLNIAGDWKFKVESALDPNAIKPLEIPYGPGHPRAPANLFNGMISPLRGFALSGFVWYQGETNVGRAEEYAKLFPKLIVSWRNFFGQGDLPFLFVQLPNYQPAGSEPDTWAELRDAQARALSLPRTAMAVTIDLGEPGDIHPRNKKPVGIRLAQAARQTKYYSTTRGLSPVFDGVRTDGSRLRILFRYTAGALTTTDNKPVRGFMITDGAGKWLPAEARIEGDSVVVWSSAVERPTGVRYAFADNPDGNLSNRDGLPAAPFRYDPSLTTAKR